MTVASSRLETVRRRTWLLLATAVILTFGFRGIIFDKLLKSRQDEVKKKICIYQTLLFLYQGSLIGVMVEGAHVCMNDHCRAKWSKK